MKAQDKIIDICLQEKATHYINAIGGREFYSTKDFKDKNIRLYFLKSKPIEYKQYDQVFVPWLSIIDVMMFNSKEEISKMMALHNLL